MTAFTTKKIEMLYDMHGPAIYGMIHCCVADNKIADEILQQVFVKLYHHIEKDESAISLSWLILFTRQFIGEFMVKNHKELIVDQHFKNEMTNATILQHFFCGKYTITQISKLLSANETAVKEKICIAMQQWRQRGNRDIKI